MKTNCLLTLVLALLVAGLRQVHAGDTPTGPAPAATSPAPAAPIDPATAFKAANPNVATAVVVVVAATNDPLDVAIASFGGFAATADVNHVHRSVKHSFAVAYDAKGHPIEALYVDDAGSVQYTTDEDLLGTYAHKAHKNVSSAPSGTSDDGGSTASSGGSGGGSGPFGSSGGGSGGGETFKVNGKTIKVGMTMDQVHSLLGSPQHKFQEGSSHEHWMYQPLNVGGDVVHGAITEVASGFGFLGLAASNAGDTVKPKNHTHTIVFDGNTVARVDSSSE
jgi:hypothetical protein